MTKTEQMVQNLTLAERIAHARSIAEGYIQSAATRSDFGGVDGYNYAYALGLTGGWFHGGLISEAEMEEFRVRLKDAILDREERDGQEEDNVECEHAWSITARLAALPSADIAGISPEIIALIDEARVLHPTMSNRLADTGLT